MNAPFLPFNPAVKKSAKVLRFHDWTLRQPCVVTGRYDGVTLHHVTAYREGGRFSRSHWLVVPLLADLHQAIWDSKNSVEALSHEGFFEKYGFDLVIAGTWNLIHYLETEGAR